MLTIHRHDSPFIRYGSKKPQPAKTLRFLLIDSCLGMPTTTNAFTLARRFGACKFKVAEVLDELFHEGILIRWVVAGRHKGQKSHYYKAVNPLPF